MARVTAPLSQARMIAADLEYVGFWPRFGAFVIDSILVTLIAAPVVSWIYRADAPEMDLDSLLAMDSRDLLASMLTPRGPMDVLINYVLPAVAIVVFWITRKATPGKMVFGARVVDAGTGNAISLGQAIVRYLGYYVSTIPLGLGLLWVAFDPRKQGWHDKLAGTVVVRTKKPPR